MKGSATDSTLHATEVSADAAAVAMEAGKMLWSIINGFFFAGGLEAGTTGA